jgi:S-formylglutathione hydrolase FrmB
MSPQQAVALTFRGAHTTPFALVTVDGGNGYWNPHPGDDPMSMVVDELLPICRRFGAGARPSSTGVMGISMGGFGALLFAERFPELFSAVAAVSPAIWSTYRQAADANRGAFASPASFANCDVITHATALIGAPVRIASGIDDPFHPGVQLLRDALPHATVEFSRGCHDDAYFASQEPASLEFLSQHLA